MLFFNDSPSYFICVYLTALSITVTLRLLKIKWPKALLIIFLISAIMAYTAYKIEIDSSENSDYLYNTITTLIYLHEWFRLFFITAFLDGILVKFILRNKTITNYFRLLKERFLITTKYKNKN